jgi:hypothetical protein
MRTLFLARSGDYLPVIFQYSPPRQKAALATFYIPGLTGGRANIGGLRQPLQECGDLYGLLHPKRGFSKTEAVKRGVDAMEGYSSILIVASSMGGLLVDPLIREVERRKLDTVVKVWASCALLSAEMADQPTALLAALCHWPLSTRPVHRVFDYFFTPRDVLPIEDGAAPEVLEDHEREMKGAKPSALRAQLRFISTATAPELVHRQECVYTRACQVAGTSDGFVREAATAQWCKSYPNTTVRPSSALRHASYVEQWQSWGGEAGLVLQHLGIQPIYS